MSLREIAAPKKKAPFKKKYTRQLTAKQVRAMKKRGYDAERELVHMFRDVGYSAVRIPVSAPSKEPLPDVFAIKDDAILSIEVKSQVRYAYYKSHQVVKLFEFLDMHKIYPQEVRRAGCQVQVQGMVVRCG